MGKKTHEIEISTTKVTQRADAMRALRRPLALTRAAMLAERVTRAFWPLWSTGFLIWTALAFHLPDNLPRSGTIAALGLAAAMLLLSLAYGAHKFRWPRVEQAVLRLDASMAGRPISVLRDSQALGAGDAASAALWRAHVARMAQRAAQARPVAPDLKISRLDPFGLRYVAATGFVIALIFGSNDPETGLSALLGTRHASPIASGPIYEGWIEPPRYTGLPAIYLNRLAGSDPLAVPVGSKVTLRLYGQPGDLAVSETLSRQPLAKDTPQVEQPAVEQLDFIAVQSGALRITNRRGDDIGWQIRVIPDTAPTITLTTAPARSPNGETKLAFQAADDYGVTHGSAVMRLDLGAVKRRYGLVSDPEPLPPIRLDLPLPFSGSTKDFKQTLAEDLSKHPWAGLPVTLTLTASDAINQSGTAAVERFALPGRRFFDPLAAALVEQRRDLLWNRTNAVRVAKVLRAVTNLPEDIFNNPKAYLLTRSAIRRLEITRSRPLSDSRRDEIAEMLWQAAVQIEDGDLSDTQKRLKRAQDRLSEALKNRATDAEIAQLSQELRRAMQDYLQKLAREAAKNPDRQQAQNRNTRQITRDQLQQMLDRIQDLSRQGRTAEAQKLLAQLNALMKNMQTARQQQGQGQGQQAMKTLQDTLRQQQDLSDQAFKRLQQKFNDQRRSGQQGQKGQQPGQSQQGRLGQQGGQGNAQTGNGRAGALDQQELSRRQGALRQLLQNQRQGLPDLASPEGRAARDALKRAERSMDGARGALDRGDLSQALNDQADALEALREGIQNLAQDMARNQSGNSGRQGDQAGRPDPNSSRDPLGRQSGSAGRVGPDENLLSGQDRYKRSREILDEIRRRSGDKRRPKVELDYLERLLDRF